MTWLFGKRYDDGDVTLMQKDVVLLKAGHEILKQAE